MGKTYHKTKGFEEDDFEEFDLKKQNMSKRRKKRMDRALRIKNIDELLAYSEEEYDDESEM